MSKLYPRLLRRNHTYYIRIPIPRCLNNIVESREIRYSLHTNDYFEALERLRRESYRADCLIRCIMRIEKSCLLFDDNDIDAALMQRLDDIDYFCQGITGRSKVFHSFRHNIETILAHKKVLQSMINAMCGWKNKSIPELNYLDKYPLSVLQKEMERLQYPYLNKCFEKLMPDPKRGIF